MEDNSQKNRKIAKNTILLYIRTFCTMLVSLYTSRVVLNVLGIENYGVYNIVGGTISMFSIFSGSLSGAISRYITYGLGEGNIEKLKKIFSTSVSIQTGLAVFIFILAEIGGLWMLNSKLNIPAERMYAAHWVLQFSILSFVTGLISTPYNACIIAHEHMKVFAYMGILEVVMKLLFVFSLYISPFDKLIVYSFLLFLIVLVLRVIYGIYCKRKFEECRYRFIIDKELLREMTGFAFWGMFGNAAYIFNNQGVNVVINLFFGVTLNAARGIVAQVEGAVLQFVNNFTTAISPQITKSYASGNLDYMFTLVCRGTKFSFFLLLLFLVPIEFEADTLLNLWLGKVPEQSSLFLKLSLIGSAVVLIGNCSFTAIRATGIIRNYQLTVSIVGCLVFPLTWVAYKYGLPAYTTYIIYIIIYSILNFIRLLFLRKLLGFNIMTFIRDVTRPILAVTALSMIVPCVITNTLDTSVFRFLLLTGISIISTAGCIYIAGLTCSERKTILAILKKRIYQLAKR